jgi:hypothetical protein
MKIILLIILSSLLASSSFGQEQNASALPDLYIFVGEKIKIKEIVRKEEPPVKTDEIKTSISSDSNGEFTTEEVTIQFYHEYKAKYKILKNVYGDLEMDTIEFKAYDHFGTPDFSKYKYVLLYVTKHNGEFYHIRHEYSALYKTKDNRWAGTYSPDYFYPDNPYAQNTKIKPELIDFKSDVVIDIKNYSNDEIIKWFPEPYFKIKKNKAIAIYGNYIEDIVQLEKDGVLKELENYK